ncbi:hypothetical protein ABFY60_15435 [Lysinibacillus pakistanensis]|uniref:hypothetical protein n=1 Tax=Lysinibacillus pakistanensis TaxID=759811 RepID=UPI003D289138
MEQNLVAFKTFYDKINGQYKKFFKQLLEEMYEEQGLNPFVFNKDLENINLSKVKYILVGDNPGFNEQKVSRYLIGSAGEIARDFFENEGLVNDFNEEVIVLNKTFLFTKRTEDLDKIYYNSELEVEHRNCMQKMEEFMAQMVFDIHTVYPEIQPMIIGFAGCRSGNEWLRTTKDQKYLKQNTLPYFFSKLSKLYNSSSLTKPLILKHFSFNQFNIDYNEHKNDKQTTLETLSIISHINSKGLFEE